MTTSQTLRRPGSSSPGQAPAPRSAVRARRARLPVALTAAGFAVAAVLTLPLVFLLIEARGAGAAAVTDLIFRRLTADLLWNTVRLTVVVTALCAVIGTAAAWCVERTNLPGRRVWAVLVVVPLAIPDFVVSFGWASLWTWVQGFRGAVVVMTLAVYPLVYLPVAASLRAAETLHPGPQRRPAEAHHEVRDGQRHHYEHRPDPPARQVGPLDAPGRGGPDDRAQRGHHDREPDRVPQQVHGQPAEDQVGDRGRAGPAGLDEQEHQRQHEHGRHGEAGRGQRHGQAGAPGAHGRPGGGRLARRGRTRPPQRLRGRHRGDRPVTAGPPRASGRWPSTRRRARRS